MWDGEDRRQKVVAVECQYSDKIIELCEKMSAVSERLEAPMAALDKHISQGHVYRVAIFGIMVTLIVNFVIIASMWGGLTQTVSHNAEDIRSLIQVNERLAILEEKVSFIEDMVIVPIIKNKEE